MSEFTIAIVGNPNCGKTTVFNALTGARQRVGNWPGVTVDRKLGSYRHAEQRIEVVDTPGIYSLSAGSVDEEIARDCVLSKQAGLIVNIVDASNIERNLYLTTQLMEMHPPLLIALNMMDVAKAKGMHIDVEALADRLGCPVIPLVASKNIGITRLKDGIGKAVAARTRCPMRVMYPVDVQEGIGKLLPHVQAAARSRRYAPDWMALKLLEGDEKITAMVDPQTVSEVKRVQGVIEDRLGDDAEMHIATARYAFIHHATRETIAKRGQVADSITDRLDRLCLSRVLGIPMFLVAMYLMFMFTINIGGAFIDFFDILAGAIFVDGAAALLSAVHAPEWMIAVLAGGIGGGLQTMATFIPPIGCMFLVLSFLEDSGYLARAAFVMDRFMRLIGLPGKAFIPMLVGFGCNVPAIMAARTLENERDRTLTVMMNPFMSCGARLPVYALFAAAFFPTSGQSLVFLLYLIGIGVAVFTGLVLKHTLLKGELTPFVMELPPYHLPTFRAIVLRAYDRLKVFLFKAGKVLIPVIMVLAFFNSMGTDGSFGNEDGENSVLAAVSRTITPVLKPIGVSDDNWPATVGVFTGIFAKEAVVGTLDALYAAVDAADSGAEEAADVDFWATVADAFASIPANLAGLGATFRDPLGLSVGNVGDAGLAAEEQAVRVATFGSMVTLFGTRAAAFAYLLFILLYFPCSAAIAAVYRETNLRWAIFAGFWTTFMAYFAAVVFYQAATFSSHPASSAVWLLSMAATLATVIAIMKIIGRSGRTAFAFTAAARA